MKTFFKLLFFLTPFLFIFSCSDDDYSFNNEIQNTREYNYFKFYKENIVAIKKMDRNELSGLNRNVAMYALDKMSKEELYNLWKGKVESNSRLENLTKSQKELLVEFNNNFTFDFFKSLMNNTKLGSKIESDFRKVGFNDIQIRNLLHNFSDVDKNLKPIHLLEDYRLLSNEKTQNFLIENYEKASIQKCGPTEDCEYIDDDYGSNGASQCRNYDCWYCSLINYECSESCTNSTKGCGLFGAFSCSVNCYF